METDDMGKLLTLLALTIMLIGCASGPITHQRARQLMTVWETGDTELLEQITSADVVYDDQPNGTRFVGRDGVRRYVEHVHRWADEVQITVTAVHGSGNAAVAEWTMRGVQSRPIPGRLAVATQRSFELKGLTLVEIRDGRIRRAADYLDVLGFVLQLGARVELPGGALIEQSAKVDAQQSRADR
jgi:steroid delta-isomerase-like uncharacterized protein